MCACPRKHPPPPNLQRYVCVCVQLGMSASPRYVTIPTPPTKGMCVCVCAYSWECMQVQGMLPSPPHPPTQPKGVCVCVSVRTVGKCMQVQGTLPSPPHPPTQPKGMCVCGRTVGKICKSKVCYHPHPTHPTDHPHSSMCATHHIRRLLCVHGLGTPTPPNLQRYVCVCVQLGMSASPRYVTIPTPPTHPAYSLQRYVCVCVQLGMYASPRYVTIPTPPTHPPNPKVCVCVCKHLVTRCRIFRGHLLGKTTCLMLQLVLISDFAFSVTFRHVQICVFYVEIYKQGVQAAHSVLHQRRH